MSSSQTNNRFLQAPVGRLFVMNAVPMVLVMAMSGLLNIVDAMFLGQFVGADALAAVSAIFPILMVAIALSTLVSGGMASLYARHLGAGQRDAAAAVFTGAHGLALTLAAGLIAVFALTGGAVTGFLSGGNMTIAAMAHVYLAISICATPLQFLIGIHADALRSEGRAGMMALMSVCVTLGNIAANYVLIVVMDLGVAGSAWGTVMAQLLGLAILVILRLRDGELLSLSVLARHSWRARWTEILALGAPLSLSFVGIAFASGVAITVLRLSLPEAQYAVDVAGYGIVTRCLGFAFLPLMAIALATQSIVGNNVGAGLYPRSDATLRLAIVTSFVYCLAIEGIGELAGGAIGAGFVSDPEVIAAVGKILKPMMVFYVTAGPILTLSLYFQAVGQPLRTAVLSLIKPFLMSPLLVVGCAMIWGGDAIWRAFPVADALTSLIALLIAWRCYLGRHKGAGFGLQNAEVPA